MIELVREILTDNGFDPYGPMKQANSSSSHVWIGTDVVVRIARASPERFRRELAIAKRVAPQVRYPEILAAGNDWSITKRIPGQELGRAWNAMTPTDRERAIRQLADMLDALHATDSTGIDDIIDGPHAVTRADVIATADRAALEMGNDVVLIFEVAAIIRERWDVAFDGPFDAFIHGDPHLENVLWDGKSVTGLLDLEWSRRGYRECDLEILLAVASHPALFAAADYDTTLDAAAFRAIPEWLARAKPSWFTHPRLADRIALMFASRTLGHLVDAPGNALRHEHLRKFVGRS